MIAGPPPFERKTRVLSVQTPLLGNRTYGELLRRAFARSQTIEFDAHWSTEAWERGPNRFERQLDRVFLKMIERPAIRSRNLDFFPLRFEIGTSYWARRSLDVLLRTRTPDVLHFHTQAVAMLSTDLMQRIPSVVSLDGTATQMAMQRLAEPWRWTFVGNHALEHRVFTRAAAIVTLSQWAASAVRTEHGIDPARIHVLPAGVDLARFRMRPSRADRPADAPFRILFVGGEFERKGGPLLVRAFLGEFSDRDRVELHVATKATDVPDHPRIFVHANVEAYSPAWHALYETADVFAMPTTRDQSPFVLLEAMASGLPVVTTPVGSATEVVRDGITGYLVPAGDEFALRARLRSLYEDPERCDELGAAGRARIARLYDADANARKLERLFAEIASR